MCRTEPFIKEITEEQKEFLGTTQLDTTDSNTAASPWIAFIKINERVVNFKINTEADVTVIPTKRVRFSKGWPSYVS